VGIAAWIHIWVFHIVPLVFTSVFVAGRISIGKAFSRTP
jgi:hypothetical protein